MTYVVSDIHGCLDAWRRALEAVSFSDADTMYVLGDMVDRGPDPIPLLQDMMMRPNVIPLLGNHEYMMVSVLRRLAVEITAGNAESHLTADDLTAYACWMENGAQTTISGFRSLPRPEQEDVLEYLEDCPLFQEVSVSGRDFVLVHAGFEPFVPGKPLEDYGIEHTLFTVPAEDASYFPGRYLITGHRPTADRRIRYSCGHYSIDCGCVFGGSLGVLRLDDLQCFYVPYL